MKFLRLAQYFERLEATTKRLEMYDVLAELFKEAPAEEIAEIVYLVQGQLLPSFYGLDMGMSEKYLIRAVSDASGAATIKVQETYARTGDLGLTAAELTRGKGALGVSTVYGELRVIAESTGAGSVGTKVGLLASLLKGVSSVEAKYVVRFVMGRLRLGIGDPTVLEALAQMEAGDILLDNNYPAEKRLSAGEVGTVISLKNNLHKDNYYHKYFHDNKFHVSRILEQSQKKKKDSTDEEFIEIKKLKETYKTLRKLIDLIRQPLERAYNLRSDLGFIAGHFVANGLRWITEETGIKPLVPVRMALCERLPTSADIIAKVGRVAVEAKYDGLRCQVHKDGKEVQIFSRNHERTTDMFPEIVRETLKSIAADSVIFEGEALAYNEDTGELLPFQETMKRKRKHGVDEMARNFPLRFFAFELLYLDGEDYTLKPYAERRDRLEKIIRDNSVIELARMFQTSEPAEIDRHFEEFVQTGLEGVVAKRLNSPYTAGARNFNWIKLKKSYKGELADSADLCVVGYYRGRGARARFGLGALLGAVYEPESDTFKTVSKIGTGFTDDELARLKATLDKVALKHVHPSVDALMEADVWVEPRYVIEVTADEITRSPSHTAGRDETGAGYALRFPRAVGFLRDDKNARDANTVKEIITMYNAQKKVKVN